MRSRMAAVTLTLAVAGVGATALAQTGHHLRGSARGALEGQALGRSIHRARHVKAHVATRRTVWVCSLGGAAVAAGWILFAGIDPVPAIGAALATGSFTAGCELGQSRDRTLLSGMSRTDTCWHEWRHHRGRRHWGRFTLFLA